jgi:putative phage-type endonuclease
MKIYKDLEQRSDEWFEARAGIPTASAFSKIMTSKYAPSKSREKYIYELAAQKFGAFANGFDNIHMERGREIEGEAFKYYEMETLEDIETVGFVVNDKGYGCSPDGVVFDGDKIVKGLEIKCPDAPTQIKYLRKGELPTEYKLQVYGSLLVTGADSWDFLSYHPALPHLLVTVKKDEIENDLETIEGHLLEVINEINEVYDEIKSKYLH